MFSCSYAKKPLSPAYDVATTWPKGEIPENSGDDDCDLRNHGGL
jgi:serine/threonine protein kinase HipA of HipAB toxin-antitoxin module